MNLDNNIIYHKNMMIINIIIHWCIALSLKIDADFYLTHESVILNISLELLLSQVQS